MDQLGAVLMKKVTAIIVCNLEELCLLGY